MIVPADMVPLYGTETALIQLRDTITERALATAMRAARRTERAAHGRHGLNWYKDVQLYAVCGDERVPHSERDRETGPLLPVVREMFRAFAEADRICVEQQAYTVYGTDERVPLDRWAVCEIHRDALQH